jgi:hypothetical protein
MSEEVGRDMSYDIIGDVHGHADQLEGLLRQLGYRQLGDAYCHPDRKAIFVGDLIDRGPGQLATLKLVRAMVETGSARVVMGNHEFNAIAWALGHRPKNEKNRKQHEAFLAEVGEGSEEHRKWVNWFLELPLWIEEANFRVVHACWSPSHVNVLSPHLQEGERLTPAAVCNGAQRGGPLYDAFETLLKGVEVALPTGVSFTDKEGNERNEIRTQWWKPKLTTYRDAYIGPVGVDIPNDLIPDVATPHEPDRPIFIGHYWLSADAPLRPRSRRVACVDYSVANHGPLVAYRFGGEQELTADNFVAWPPRRKS